MHHILLCTLLAAALSSGAFLSSGAVAQDKRFNVMMVLFRGVTAAENGFMDRLKERLPVTFTMRNVGGDRNKVREFVDEARRDRPDLIYTFGTTVTLEMVGATGKVDPQRHITDIPTIFNIVADPLGAEIASGVGATGRNVTGVSHLVPMADQLKAMQRFKQVKKLGVIYNPNETNSALAVAQLKQNSSEFRFELVEAAVHTAAGQTMSPTDIATAMRTLINARVDFIYLPSDSSLIERAAAIVGLATAARIPVISATEGPIRSDGALLGLVSNYYSAGTFAAHKAEQILLGNQPVGRIPIETLQRFALVVSMTTAVQLGLYPPLDLIRIAELL